MKPKIPCMTVPNVPLYAHFYNMDEDSHYVMPIVAIEWFYARYDQDEDVLQSNLYYLNDNGNTELLDENDEFVVIHDSTALSVQLQHDVSEMISERRRWQQRLKEKSTNGN
jgi:hypothetical protein